MKVKKGGGNCIFYFSTILNIISVFSSISVNSFTAKNTLHMIVINFAIYGIWGNIECVLCYEFLYTTSHCP